MEIKYQIFENEKLLIQKYSGVFSIENYMKYTHSILNHFGNKQIKNVIIDFRDLVFSDVPHEVPDDFLENLERMVDFRKNINENKLKNKDVKLVIWVDNPIPTVIVHLFTANFSENNYSYCSTDENVIEIFQLPERFNNLERIVRNLENTFKNE